MKHPLFFLLCIMLFNSVNITATKDDNQKYITTNEKGEKSFSICAHYFILKEYCKFIVNFPFMLVKFNHASIYCCKAHHKNDASKLWAYLIFKFDEAQIDELKNHVYNDSTEELTAFILQKNQEFKLDCRQCGQYSGYYIPEHQSAEQY